MNDRIVFRVDGGQHIGMGHIQRCLTLALQLKHISIVPIFAVIGFDLTIIKYIKAQGVHVVVLPMGNGVIVPEIEGSWIAKTQEEDANDFLEQILTYKPIACVVDHYSLDEIWERRVSRFIPNIVVIDDLANRRHNCRLLIDQNYWPYFETRYDDITNSDCIKLLGPHYTLLRSEFKQMAANNVVELKKSKQSILINFGGIGEFSLLSTVLEVLIMTPQYHYNFITGQLGQEDFLKLQSMASASDNIDLLERTDEMALLMANSYFAIGACGSSVWERFCLGLNSALISVANNQSMLIQFLERKKLIDNLGYLDSFFQNRLFNCLMGLELRTEELTKRKYQISSLVDGNGALRVSDSILRMIENA